MKLYAAIIILANFLATSNAETVPNQVIDAVLEELAARIINDGYNQINLTNFHCDFTYIWIFGWTGSMSCVGGKVHSFAKMQRIGETNGNQSDGKFVGSATVGLDALVLNLDKCGVEYEGYYCHMDKADATLDKNVLFLSVTVDANHTATVTKLQLTQISDVRFTHGSELFDGLFDGSIKTINTSLEDYVIKNVNMALQKYQNIQFNISNLPILN